jgi:hypothetical protein
MENMDVDRYYLKKILRFVFLYLNFPLIDHILVMGFRID